MIKSMDSWKTRVTAATSLMVAALSTTQAHAELPVRRVVDFHLGLNAPSFAHFCAEAYPFSFHNFAIEGCLESVAFVTEASGNMKFRFGLGSDPTWFLGPLAGVRQRLGEFEGPFEFPLKLDVGASLEWARFKKRTSNLGFQFDAGGSLSLTEPKEQGLPFFARASLSINIGMIRK